MCRVGNKLFSQPIKGTLANRGNLMVEKEQLRRSEKDRAENLMIVDLVRNDLNRVSKPQSVTVEELFGIYSYPTVHQMISTISSEIDEKTTLSDVLRHSFPMGSMTGAPKLSAMKLIERFEDFKRGIYSGAIGYALPDGTFDLNVVIRTVLYDSLTNKINLAVGSAITIDSTPGSELEECNMKVGKIIDLLQGKVPIQ